MKSNRISRPAGLPAMSLVLIALALLAACRQGNDTAPAVETVAAPTSEAAAAPTAQSAAPTTQSAAPTTQSAAPTTQSAAPTTQSAAPATEASGEKVFGNGIFWQWAALADAAGTETPIVDQAAYTLSILDQGMVVLAGGCTATVGTGTLDGASLTLAFDPPAAPAESCETGPDEARFFELLQGATSYRVADGRLYVNLKDDGGAMVFDRLPDAVAASGGESVSQTTVVDICGPDVLALNEVDATLPAAQIAALDALLPTFITQPSSVKPAAPGAAILVISPEGRYFKAVGVADVATCAPLQADSPFEIGSNTKMMTAAIIYQLQEEGVLATSDMLADWLPEMAAIVPNGDQITLDMLLTHTAGIYDYLNGTIGDGPLAAGATDRDVLTSGYTPEELVRLAVDAGAPYFAPGAADQWMYSNTGYILLGMIIEQATGKSYAQNLQERFFEPLGMTSTFLADGIPEPGLLPTGYFQSPFDYATTDWNTTQAWSAGAVISTAEDLAVFLKALFSGALYQDPATLETMLQAAQPNYAGFNDGYYYGHGMFHKYGLLGHGGQALGYQSDVGYAPEADTTIVIWTNSAENTVGSAAPDVGRALGLDTTGQ